MEKMNFETVDGAARNVEKLARLFPNCVKECVGKDGKITHAVDYAALKRMLGEETVSDEKYELTWVGKKDAVSEANRKIRKTLRPVKEDSQNWDSTQNIYIEGDNLDVLKLLQESYLNAVKVIYIDPPYNTGNDFVYMDDFHMDADTYEEELGVYDGSGNRMFRNNDTNGRFHSDWCSMIYARLLLARNLLKEDGAIFISIDDNEQDNLKKICDEVFGEKNFVNCFVWNCSTAGGIRPRFASKTHEYVFCYAKDKTQLAPFYAPLSGDAKKMYSQKDEKGIYRDKDFIFKNKSTNINQKYEIECPDGELVHPKDGYIYRFVRDRFEEALKEGLVTFKKTETGPLLNAEGEQAHWNIYIKKYLGDAMGAPATLVPKEMISIYNAGTQCVQDLFDGTRVFENVKPVNLIRYFIDMVAQKGDTVLDFFSGSATTAHAVMQANVDKDMGLKYIMVQIPEKCDEKSDAYKNGYMNVCEIGKERIRRAAKKIQEDNPGCRIDTGFRVFRLDESNMRDVYYPAEEYSQEMLSMLESNIKEDRTDLDLLFGCLLEMGLPLSLPHDSEYADGCTIHRYNGGDLTACFDENIPESVIRRIAGCRPRRAVFRDSGFAGSREKINAEEIFRLLAPDTRVKVI